MTRALELFHYSYQFRDKVFVFAFETADDLEKVIVDLRVIKKSHIRLVLLCCKDREFLRLNYLWKGRVEQYRLFDLDCAQSISLEQSEKVKRELGEGRIPVLAMDLPAGKSRRESFLHSGFRISESLGASKLFYLSPVSGLFVNRRFRSHPTPEELSRLLEEDAEINISKKLLSVIRDEQQGSGIELVLLRAKRGDLFQEVFTHRGKGTLFASVYPNLIRRATPDDIDDLSVLLHPYVRSGAILPVSEQELARTVSKFYVFTVNEAIVAAARLQDYGEAVELAKFCTLPRYQGRGRARKLGRHLISVAKKEGKKAVFALSVEARMLAFFQRLGLSLVEREKLPERWKENYDFSRPSRAMWLDL